MHKSCHVPRPVPLSDLNILRGTIFSNTCTLCSPLNVIDQVSHTRKTRETSSEYRGIYIFWKPNWKTKESAPNYGKNYDYICSLIKKQYTCNSSLAAYPHPTSTATMEGGQANFVSVTYQLQFPTRSKTLHLYIPQTTAGL
jgi:hypothetical protein